MAKYGQQKLNSQSVISKEQIFDIALQAESQFANVPINEQWQLGIDLHDFILSCKFMKHNCSDVGKFVLYKHYQFINCYTFRFKLIHNGTRLKILSGPENGLSLILVGNRVLNNIYNSESTQVNVNGIKVVVHERGSIPPIASSTIDIQSGKSTNIGLVARRYSRLNSPYGKCVDRKENKSAKYIYTTELCEQLAISKRVYDTCKCHSVKFESEQSKINETENCFYISTDRIDKMLASFNSMICEDNAIRSHLGEEHNECHWPCEETDYYIQISETRWPAQIMVPNFIERYIESLPCSNSIRWSYQQLVEATTTDYERQQLNIKLCSESYLTNPDAAIGVSLDDFRLAYLDIINGNNPAIEIFKNATLKVNIDEAIIKSGSFKAAQQQWLDKYFYRLNIYFRVKSTEHHEQVISMSYTDFLSSAGGVLGLWAGCSAVTGFEIFILCGKLLASCNKRVVGETKVGTVDEK